MALEHKRVNKDSSPVIGEESILQKIEIEYLLDLVKNSSFPGSHLETVYNIVYRLQQQYLNQK
jgi:hypothetical protein